MIVVSFFFANIMLSLSDGLFTWWSCSFRLFSFSFGFLFGNLGTLEFASRSQEETANAMVATAKDNDSRDQDWNKLAKKVSAFVAMSRLTLAIS